MGPHPHCVVYPEGYLQGIVDNLRDALDKQYYSQLKHCLMAYQNVTPFLILELEHLNNCWCPLDVKAKKALKDAYYTKWDGSKHLTTFGKRLDNNQRSIVCSNVTIADYNKLQFYLEEMNNSNHYDKNKMLDWEQQSTTIKTNYMLARQYLEALVKVADTYEQNTGGGTAGQNKYKSVNQLADCGDEICNYLAQIASAVTANNNHAANTQAKDTQFNAMLAQIKALTEAVAKLMASKGNKNVNPNTNNGDKGNGKRRRTQVCPQPQQLTKICNMFGCCYSHGFHPAGINHNSKNCNWKIGKHNPNATWNNCMGRRTYWPAAIRVAIKQEDHMLWKGKSAPTN